MTLTALIEDCTMQERLAVIAAVFHASCPADASPAPTELRFLHE